MNATPAVDGHFADPNLCVFDGVYYLYPTTDGLPDWGADAFRVFSSTDLVRWTDHGDILTLGTDVTWARRHAWAPTVARHGGQYFLYFTAADNIGVATARSPLGPFTDIGEPLITDGEFEGRAIDPSVFVDHDGRSYLLWGNGTAHAVELNEDMVSFDRDRVVSWRPKGFREAPWIHRHGDRYYLSWSENDTREPEYRVRYAVGLGPFGPWTDEGLILEPRPELGILSTGHHSIVRLPDGGWVIAYHRFAIPAGNGYNREVVIDRLFHDEATGLIRPIVPSRVSFGSL